MRVISLVPSWTETLVEAGVEVVGRSKFCIHPADAVAAIPAVGGTKRVNWDKVRALDADLLLLDKEENTLAMALESPIPYFATHVTSIADLAESLASISGRLDQRPTASPALLDIAERWRAVCIAADEAAGARGDEPPPLEALPGVLQWVQPPGPEVDRLVYLIWRDPWMAVGPKTFIGSVLAALGYGAAHVTQNDKYPTVELERFDRRRTLLCFSSEPYPFGRHPERMRETGFAAALVDGEAFSWFGVRALRFLEGALGLGDSADVAAS